jgi:uncharacterized protein with ATP-grasp and redox domains
MALRPGVYHERLAALRREAAEGRISDPFTDPGLPHDKDAFAPEELAAWREEIEKYSGLLWKDAPFYFVEAYLYLKILLASGYYEASGEYFRADPYEAAKRKELDLFLSGPGVQSVFVSFAGMRGKAADAKDFEAALLFMLRANRMDLSNAKIAEVGRTLILEGGREDLLVDHTRELAAKIAASRRVDIILDNAGAELAADLLFVWRYLVSGPSRTAVLHAKLAPTFVSDALVKDLRATATKLKDLPPAGRIGEDLEAFLAEGRLLAKDHYFWNGPKHFPAMPAGLRAVLAGADLVLLKGDANFRRIIEDRRWPFSVNLETLGSWFPADFAVLRTLKSEVAADIPGGIASRMDREHPGWLTDGRWGYVRLVLCKG